MQKILVKTQRKVVRFLRPWFADFIIKFCPKSNIASRLLDKMVVFIEAE